VLLLLAAAQSAAAAPSRASLHDGEDPNAALRRAAGLAREGRLEDALELYADLARAHPRSEAPHVAAGNALLAAGRLEEAIDAFESAARLAPHPAPILTALARLYLDPQVRRPSDALNVTRAARRLEPWREESYYLQARAHEALGDQEGARKAYRTLVANFPAGRHRDAALRGLDKLSRAYYAITLGFRFQNRGSRPADQVRFRVQAAHDFPPYSEARLLELPPGGKGRKLADGTRYLGFEPFDLGPGEERTLRLSYAIAVSAEAYGAAGAEPDAGTLAQFLAASPYIESDAPEIVSLSRDLAAGPGAERERARLFYDFVLKRLSYVVQAETQGALGALANPTQADCTEFAALFIALTRAAGIPARPVFGYLYEADRSTYEISHLWAEFWEEGQGWVNADPTNGTLEPDRYFARVESNYIPLWVPHPSFGDLAGVQVSYKSPGEGDPLFTELVTEIHRIPASEFDSVQPAELAFADAAADERGPAEVGAPVVPAAVLFAAALGLRAWQRRARSV